MSSPAFVRGVKSETFKQYVARLRDPLRWRAALADVGIWFMVGAVLTTLLSRVAPGYPIIVGTPSISTGVYWLDKQAFTFKAGDYVTFDFNPLDPVLKARYGANQPRHTKLVRAVAGDVITADAQGWLTVCPAPHAGYQSECVTAGKPESQDSKGRVLVPWLAPGKSYVMPAGLLWIYGPHPQSLDSRYQGPIEIAEVVGRASPVWIWTVTPEQVIPRKEPVKPSIQDLP